MLWYQVLRERREKLGLSQADLAKSASVSQSLINRIEKGDIKETSHLEQISNALGLEYKDIKTEHQEKTVQTLRSDRYSLKNIPSTYVALLISDLVEDRDGVLEIFPVVLRELCRPEPLTGSRDAYALIVQDDGLSPELKYGDVVYLDPYAPVVPGSTALICAGREDNREAKFYHISRPPSEDLPLYKGRILNIVDVTRTHWIARTNSMENQDILFELSRSEWPMAHRVVAKDYRR